MGDGHDLNLISIQAVDKGWRTKPWGRLLTCQSEAG